MPRSRQLVKRFCCGIALYFRKDQLNSLLDQLRGIGIRLRKMLPEYSDGIMVGVTLHVAVCQSLRSLREQDRHAEVYPS